MAQLEYKPCDAGVDISGNKVIKWDYVIERMNYRIFHRKDLFPVTVACELTPLCSLRCNMCFARLDKKTRDSMGEELTTQQWIDLLQQAADCGALYLVLTGGECMLRSDFCEIYEAASNMGYFIYVFTNATLVNDKIIELFRRRPPQKVSATIYGASPETYEKVCGVRDGFERAVAGLDRIASIKGTCLELKMTVTTENLDDVPAVAKLCYERYGEHLLISFADFKQSKDTVGSAADTRPTEEQRAWAMENSLYIDDGKEELERIYSSDERVTERKAFEKYDDDEPDEENDIYSPKYIDPKRRVVCAAARSAIEISWQGKMHPCQALVSPTELPLEIGYKQACRNLRAKIEKIITPKKCLSCIHRARCGACAGKVQSNTGSYEKEPEDCGYVMAWPLFWID